MCDNLGSSMTAGCSSALDLGSSVPLSRVLCCAKLDSDDGGRIFNLSGGAILLTEFVNFRVYVCIFIDLIARIYI
jgi:hypothetical protein